MHEETPVEEQLNYDTQCGVTKSRVASNHGGPGHGDTALVSGAGARGGTFIITNISRENLLIPSLGSSGYSRG